MALRINSTTIYENGVCKKVEAPKTEQPKVEEAKPQEAKPVKHVDVPKTPETKQKTEEAEPQETPQSKVIIDGSQIKRPKKVTKKKTPKK